MDNSSLLSAGTIGLWPDPIQADLGGTDLAAAVAARRWSYVIMDAHLKWPRGINPEPDLLVVVGPGNYHQRSRWEHVIRQCAKLPPSLLVFLVRSASTSLRTKDYLTDRLERAEVVEEKPDCWQRILDPVLPASSLRKKGWWIRPKTRFMFWQHRRERL